MVLMESLDRDILGDRAEDDAAEVAGDDGWEERVTGEGCCWGRVRGDDAAPELSGGLVRVKAPALEELVADGAAADDDDDDDDDVRLGGASMQRWGVRREKGALQGL